MYHIFIDQKLAKKNSSVEKLKDEKSELIYFEDYEDLIKKINIENKNIVFLADFDSYNDAYDKVRTIRGKNPSLVINLVTNKTVDDIDLKRVGLNEIVGFDKIENIQTVLQQSKRIIDLYFNSEYIHVDATEGVIDNSKVNIISVVSGSGGVGKSFIATNLAASYAEFGLKTCLVDLSLQFGDIGLLTNIVPRFSVYDMAVSNVEANPNISLFIEKLNSNLFVLPAPVLPEQADYVTRSNITSLVKTLAKYFEVIVFDTANVINDIMLEALSISHQFIVTTTKDINSIKNTKLYLDLLEKLRIAQKAKIVVNKNTHQKYELDDNSVRKMLGLKEIFLVPFEEILVENSFNEAIPLIYLYPETKIADSIRALMSTLRLNSIMNE